LDESVFAADSGATPARGAAAERRRTLSRSAAEPTWNAAKRQLVSDALNALNAISED
jgi:hypothetical protein